MHETAIQVGPASFRIGSAWREVIDQIEMLYASYPKPKLTDYTVTLDAVRPWRRFIRPSAAINGDFMLPDAAPLPLDHGLLGIEMGVNLQMALGWRRQLILHASSVEKDGKSLIMSGESGSGKSTLSAILGHRGWRFMGDEFALINHDNGFAMPYPRMISLKNEAIKTMKKEAPHAQFGPLMKDTPKGDIQHIVPPADAIRKMEQGAKPALLLFPNFGYDAEIREIFPSEVFMRLTQASTNFVGLGETGFNTLKRLVLDVPAFEIAYQNGDEAEDMINQLWEQL